jgi:hypothetical protein
MLPGAAARDDGFMGLVTMDTLFAWSGGKPDCRYVAATRGQIDRASTLVCYGVA